MTISCVRAKGQCIGKMAMYVSRQKGHDCVKAKGPCMCLGKWAMYVSRQMGHVCIKVKGPCLVCQDKTDHVCVKAEE